MQAEAELLRVDDGYAAARLCGWSGSRLTNRTAFRRSVSPIYVAVTNPLSRLEVIMQTSSISGKAISVTAAIKEVILDSKKFGMRGVFRGQGAGGGAGLRAMMP